MRARGGHADDKEDRSLWEDITSAPLPDGCWCSVLTESQTKFQAVLLQGKPDCSTTACLPRRAQKEKIMIDIQKNNLTY